MCLPAGAVAALSAVAPYATAASLGLHLASTMQANAADRKVRRAQDSAMAENARQQRAQQEGINARLAQAGAEAGRPAFDANVAKRAGEIEGRIAPTEITTPAGGEYSAGAASAPKEVREDLARRLYDVLQQGRDYAKRSAQLTAFGEAGFDQGQAITRSGQDIANFRGNMAGNSGILPSQMQLAHREGGGNRLASDLLGGAGDIAMIYGIYGGKKPPTMPNDGGGYASVFRDAR